MSVKQIKAEDLRRMNDTEGLILQGCGGDLQEWVDGINDMLTKSDILLNGTKFKTENCLAFANEGLTNLLFPFSEDVKLNMGKLAMWCLQTHSQFSGKWLSDYVDNRLGGFVSEKKQKPNCKLIGEDGNIFNLMGIASRTLRQNGMAEEAVEMRDRIRASGSYDEALCIIGEYVNITGDDESSDEDIWMILWSSKVCKMEIAMLIIGLMLGGCIATVILCCFQINRVNCYEQTVQSLKEKLNKE